MGGYHPWQIVFILPVMFYSLLSELFLNGQTFGKMVLKIKVVKLDGSELTLGACLIRWVLRIIDIWLISGSVAIISMLVSQKSQRLGDLASGTTVVKIAQKDLWESTTFMEVPQDYTTAYPQSQLLSDQDANTIKEVLNFVNKENNTGSDIEYHPMHLKLQKVLKQKLQIQDINGSARKFLEDLLKDFNYLHQ
ncbi:RDD family protein [Saccharicrinis fermentans]|uniref:RDD family protein n=1 Tax=Saccharicrinis fermentans TaxID=982 RepID=UPI0004BBEC51|nr:RDD family protein [Saccharicrinis fermentans]